jgi:hypothetical protein
MDDVVVTYFLRYEMLLGDGWIKLDDVGSLPNEGAARAYFDDLVHGTGPRVRNARIVRREERVIQAQGGAAGD